MNSESSLHLTPLKNTLWRVLDRLFRRAKKISPAALDLQNVRSVLVIRPDRLGDVVLSTPVYESIKRSFPDARVSVLVNQAQEEILRDNPFVDRIICFRHGHPVQVYRDLNKERFDLAIVLNTLFSATAATLALFSRARFRAGYENGRGAWVFHINVPKSGEIKHEIQNNLDLLRFLGFSAIRDTPAVYFNPNMEQKIEALLAQKIRYPDRPLVLVKPGTRVPQWGWSLDKFRTVINRLLETHLAEVFIICGPGEENSVADLTSGMLNQPVILPVLTTRELSYLIKRADLLFCNHTGIMHLASAVKTPVVAVFKHGDTRRWGPYKTRNLVLSEKKGEQLSPETTLKAIQELLPRTSSEPLKNFS